MIAYRGGRVVIYCEWCWAWTLEEEAQAAGFRELTRRAGMLPSTATVGMNEGRTAVIPAPPGPHCCPNHGVELGKAPPSAPFRFRCPNCVKLEIDCVHTPEDWEAAAGVTA